MSDPPPKLTPDVFSVSRRFDMATILVAMVGYSILFSGLRLVNEVLKAPPTFIGVVGLFVAIVAVAQAVTIRWNNPRAASVIAGTLFWVGFALFLAVTQNFRNPYEAVAIAAFAAFFGPFLGYLAGTLVGGVFPISHYLRESNGLRRAPAEDEDADSPWGVTPSSMPPADDYEWPVMIEVPPPDKK